MRIEYLRLLAGRPIDLCQHRDTGDEPSRV
jgi:hypothetical protein